MFQILPSVQAIWGGTQAWLTYILLSGHWQDFIVSFQNCPYGHGFAIQKAPFQTVLTGHSQVHEFWLHTLPPEHCCWKRQPPGIGIVPIGQVQDNVVTFQALPLVHWTQSFPSHWNPEKQTHLEIVESKYCPPVHFSIGWQAYPLQNDPSGQMHCWYWRFQTLPFEHLKDLVQYCPFHS